MFALLSVVDVTTLLVLGCCFFVFVLNSFTFACAFTSTVCLNQRDKPLAAVFLFPT